MEGLAVYDSVVAYDEIDSLPGNRAVYVDISGDGGIRAAVHNRYGDRLAHSAAVGATYHDQLGAAAGEELTGPAGLLPPTASPAARRLGHREAGRERRRGVAALCRVGLGVVASRGSRARTRSRALHLELLDGKVDPEAGTVVELDGSA